MRAESVVVLAKFRVTDLERKERVGYEEEERKRADESDPTVSNVAGGHKCKKQFPRGEE